MPSRLDPIPVLNQLYAAALDFDAWPDALSAIKHAAGANGAQLLLADGAHKRSLISAGIDPEQNRLYNQYYSRFDPVPAKLTALGQGNIVSCSQILTEDARQSAFFQEWADPNHISDAVFLKLSNGGDSLWALALGHSYRGEPFLDRSLGRFLDTLAPHLVNILLISRKLEALAGEASGSRDWLDDLGCAWMLLSGDGRLLCANETALAMTRAGDGLAVQGGALAVGDADTNATFRKAVTAAGRSRDAVDFGRPIHVCRPSGATPYVIRMMPCRQDGIFLGETPGKVTIIIADPAREDARLVGALTAKYDLTPAEAQVALLVRHGHGLGRVAEKRGVSLSTVRVHLQHIFEKTATHRQAELVGLIERLRRHEPLE